jgi:hypothetical protein
VKSKPSVISEEKALGALLSLLESYQNPDYVEKAIQIARRVDYDHRTFLEQLRRYALGMQTQTLQIRGFPETYEGMRKLEGACVVCARYSTQVKELLRIVRRACYGGQDGMWPIIMEGAKRPTSSHR